MKTIFKVIAVVLFIGTFTACVHDDDYSVPTNLGATENANLTTLLANATELTIQQVKDQFVSGTVTQITSDVYVKGYVTSSDESGNFYKEFFMQDSPTNPTAAIKVVVDASDLFAKYNFGREVYINLKDMYVGETRSGDGVIAIGELPNADGDEVEAFRSNVAAVKILRSNVTEVIVPLDLALQQIGAGNIGMFVKSEAQFPTNLATALFVNANDSYDTPRALEYCDGFGYVNFTLETSTFANFKNIPLPTGSGTIAGVINNNYNGSYMVMVLNNVADVQMDNTRCTPLDINDFNPVLEEDFNTATNNTNLNITGWTNFAEAGGRVWREKTYSGNGFTEFSAYNSGDASNIAWLVSPVMDMDAQTTELLSFTTAKHHLDSALNTLEVFVSTDYDGTNVLAATWIPVSANLASISSSNYTWINSGSVDLSSYTGNLYVAFKYTGSGTDNTLDGAFRLDDFSVMGI